MAKIIAAMLAAFVCLAANLPFVSAETTAVYLDRSTAAGRLAAYGDFYHRYRDRNNHQSRESLIEKKALDYKTNYAPNIAVVITGDESILVEGNVRDAVNDLLEIKFPWRYYNVRQDSMVYASLFEAVENEVARREVQSPDQYTYNMGIGTYYKDPVDLNNLHKSHLLEAGRKAGVDYIIMLSFYTKREFSYGPPYTLIPMWPRRNQRDVAMRARCLNIASGQYLHFRDVVEPGKSTTFFAFFGHPGKHAIGRARGAAARECLMTFLSELNIGETISRKKLEHLWRLRQIEKAEAEEEGTYMH